MWKKYAVCLLGAIHVSNTTIQLIELDTGSSYEKHKRDI